MRSVELLAAPLVGSPKVQAQPLMPQQIAEDHIASWSEVGDLIFDPFAGAGTTLKMALLNHRRFPGFEINPKYVKIARRRLKEAEAAMASSMRKAN